VGETFARRSGYLETADANRIVLLFPQVAPSTQPLNPLGCWDWWGYEGADYATRDGRQVAAVRRMVGALLGEAATGGADERSP
jgi:poly(3-hydroxybutyrate) depolymerase